MIMMIINYVTLDWLQFMNELRRRIGEGHSFDVYGCQLSKSVINMSNSIHKTCNKTEDIEPQDIASLMRNWCQSKRWY